MNDGRADDVEFYIHADYKDEKGWPLERHLEGHGIEDAVIPYKGTLEREKLMRLSNRFDVFTSATGEGFGLTTIEAMSQGTPVVITDFTTSEEHVVQGEPGPRGSLIGPSLLYDEHPQFASVQRALVATDAYAETFLEYYQSPERIR